MTALELTVGLEIHAELKTRTKMFCACINDPDERTPNRHICPVCMAHPGALPVINRDAVAKVLMMGKAVGGVLASKTEFHRKNYFYPDIPKGYQISQYDNPLVTGGSLGGVAITRIHLEEDTARSQHEGGKSLVDFNRAGVPLMELVTEPTMHTPELAGQFAKELQLLLRYLGAGEANMEKGEMRVEANISVGLSGGPKGTKVEVKNLNSFRSVERAIAYEYVRQSKALADGGRVEQETRGWDDAKQATFSQRLKESSHDYRYVPDPDLPPLYLGELPDMTSFRLPELPAERLARYLSLGLKSQDADLFVRDRILGTFFDMVIAHSEGVSVVRAANYINSDLAGLLQSRVFESSWLSQEKNAARFGKLMQLLEENMVSSRGAKDILACMATDTSDPESIARTHGLIQEHGEEALASIARQVVDTNPSVVADYRTGKVSAIQFLVGQGMRATKGSANPESLRAALVAILEAKES